MWKLAALAGLLLCVAFVAGAMADTDDAVVTTDPPLPEAEYITGTPLPPSSEPPTPQKDPFKPYDFGEGVTPISESELSPAEQEVVERGRNAMGWKEVHDAYGAAARELAGRARAEAAARQLGVDDLAVQGVVP